MALRQLVQNNIDLAFRLIGDLATEATLTVTSTGTYTFGGAAAPSGAQADAPVVVTGVVQSVSRDESEDEQSNGTQIIFPAYLLPANFNRYTTITLAGDAVPWDVIDWSSDGHLTTADIRRTIV